VIIKRILIVVILIVCVIVIRYPGYWPGVWSDKSAAYHQWLYINADTTDATGKTAMVTDIEGDQIPEFMVIPAFRKDRLIFVNRMPTAVQVRFPSAAVFGAGNNEFTIEPGKRKVRKVIGPNDNYTFELNAGSGWIGSPTVKVGDDP